MRANLAVIILGAGKGTRRKSGLPMVLHTVADWPKLVHVLAATEPPRPDATEILLVPGKVAMAALMGPSRVALQPSHRGAMRSILPESEDLPSGNLIAEVCVAYGETPPLTSVTLTRLVAKRRRTAAALSR